MTRIIGVTGGKGGTGKSTIATALAVVLGKKHKVLLTDMDTGCPNDHLLLSIKRNFVKNIYQRIPEWDFQKCTKCGLCGKACETNAIISVKNRNPLFVPSQCNGCGACVITCPYNAIGWGRKEIGKIYEGKGHGVDYLSGELKINEPIAEFIVGAVEKEIEKRKDFYDFIIIDTAAGTHCDVISSLMLCNMALAVTEPTPLGIHDAKLIMELMSKLGIPYDIILNRYEKGNEEMVKDIVNNNGRGPVLKVPYRKEIMESYSRGIPVKDKNIADVARRIQGKSDRGVK